MTTIIYAHPYIKSFNHAVLEETMKALHDAGRDYQLIDLYADGFDPVMDSECLRLYSRGQTADPLVMRYLDILVSSHEVIMIFPIWWGMMPAIIKGFFDKVMLAGTAYRYSDAGDLIPDKIHIKRSVIFTTSQAPTEVFRRFFCDYFKPMVLEPIGFGRVEWYNCDETSHGPASNRDAFLDRIKDRI